MLRQDICCASGCLQRLWQVIPRSAQDGGLSAQADEREQIEAQAQLLAFDRQNHSGASDALAANLKVLLALCCPSDDMSVPRRLAGGLQRPHLARHIIYGGVEPSLVCVPRPWPSAP